MAARRTIETAEKLWVKQEIKKLYKKKDLRNSLVYRKYLTFANHSYTAIFEILLNEVNLSVLQIIVNKKNTLSKKLSMLTNQQKSRESAILFDCDFYPRTVNKTKIAFNSEAVFTKAYILKLFQLGKF